MSELPVVVGLALRLDLRPQALGAQVGPVHTVGGGQRRLLSFVLAAVSGPRMLMLEYVVVVVSPKFSY